MVAIPLFEESNRLIPIKTATGLLPNPISSRLILFVVVILATLSKAKIPSLESTEDKIEPLVCPEAEVALMEE